MMRGTTAAVIDAGYNGNVMVHKKLKLIDQKIDKCAIRKAWRKKISCFV